MSALDTVRRWVPATARERIYIGAAAVVSMLASWGAIDVSSAPAWTALAVSVVTLGFAILHSTSTLRTALYSLLLGVQGVAQLYGVLTDTQWASIVGLASAVLGLGVAAAKTPTAITWDGITSAISTAAHSRLVSETTGRDRDRPSRSPAGGAAN